MASKMKTDMARRRNAAEDALASVRAEGLEPSESALKLAEKYVNGEITANQMHQQALDEIKNRKY